MARYSLSVLKVPLNPPKQHLPYAQHDEIISPYLEYGL